MFLSTSVVRIRHDEVGFKIMSPVMIPTSPLKRRERSLYF